MPRRKIEEGFYEASLRDGKVLCYVAKSHRPSNNLGDYFASFSNGSLWPVSFEPRSGNYTLASNLGEPISNERAEEFATMINRFIYTNLGRLKERREISERIKKGKRK